VRRDQRQQRNRTRAGRTTEVDAFLDDAVKPELEIEESNLPAAAEALGDLFAKTGLLFDRKGPVKIVATGDDEAVEAVRLTEHAVVNEAHKVCRPIL
jgi:hypothetical protein